MGRRRNARSYHGTTRRARLAAIALVSMLGSGCHSWHRQSASPAEAIPALGGGRVRLTLVDSGTVVLRSAEVRADSIFGARAERDGLAIAIPVERVGAVEVRRFSVLKTSGLIVAPFAAYMTLFLLAVAYSGGAY